MPYNGVLEVIHYLKDRKKLLDVSLVATDLLTKGLRSKRREAFFYLSDSVSPQERRCFIAAIYTGSPRLDALHLIFNYLYID